MTHEESYFEPDAFPDRQPVKFIADGGRNAVELWNPQDQGFSVYLTYFSWNSDLEYDAIDYGSMDMDKLNEHVEEQKRKALEEAEANKSKKKKRKKKLKLKQKMKKAKVDEHFCISEYIVFYLYFRVVFYLSKRFMGVKAPSDV